MPHVDEISRREFLNKGWTLTKAGLLVPPGLAFLSACNPEGGPHVIMDGLGSIAWEEARETQLREGWGEERKK